jgi:hypothetical protein
MTEAKEPAQPLDFGSTAGLGAGDGQPDNGTLLDAMQWVFADVVDWPARARLQELRNARTTWMGTEDLAMRREIDRVLGDYWIRDDQASLLTMFWCDKPYCDQRGVIRSQCPGGWVVAFTVETSIDNLRTMVELMTPNDLSSAVPKASAGMKC